VLLCSELHNEESLCYMYQLVELLNYIDIIRLFNKYKEGGKSNLMFIKINTLKIIIHIILNFTNTSIIVFFIEVYHIASKMLQIY
jgi:hypothetical protein